MTKPAIIEDWLPLPNPVVGQRSIKMLRPVCRICEAKPNRTRDWATRCTHDPYVSSAKVTENRPVYEDLPDGRKKQTGVETIVSWEPHLNIAEITLSMKINSGQGVVKAQRKGFIFPEELKSPHYPNGIAPVCQFRGCYSQQNLKDYGPGGSWGTYCRDIEAALVQFTEDATAHGGALEVGFDTNSQRIREKQLREVLAGV